VTRRGRRVGNPVASPAVSDPMNCSDYVANFSDHLDGGASAEDVRAMEAHVAECGACRHYREVVERGSALLRSLPEPELSEDFGPRLQHRLYHVDEASLEGATSATPAMTVLGMAILLTAVAWSPALLGGSPEVQLEPIIVDQAPARLSVQPAGRALLRLDPVRPRSTQFLPLDEGLWDDSQRLLYEYSPLSQRYQQQGLLRRTGLDQRR